MVSTAGDIVTMLRAQLRGELLPADLRREMLNAVESDWEETDRYGLGIGEITALMDRRRSPCGSAGGISASPSVTPPSRCRARTANGKWSSAPTATRPRSPPRRRSGTPPASSPGASTATDASQLLRGQSRERGSGSEPGSEWERLALSSRLESGSRANQIGTRRHHGTPAPTSFVPGECRTLSDVAREWSMAVTSEGDRVAETECRGRATGHSDPGRANERCTAALGAHGSRSVLAPGSRARAATHVSTRTPRVSGGPLPALAAEDYAQDPRPCVPRPTGATNTCPRTRLRQTTRSCSGSDDDDEAIGLCRVVVSERSVERPRPGEASALAPRTTIYDFSLGSVCASWAWSDRPRLMGRHGRDNRVPRGASALLRSNGSADGNSSSTRIELTRRLRAEPAANPTARHR